MRVRLDGMLMLVAALTSALGCGTSSIGAVATGGTGGGGASSSSTAGSGGMTATTGSSGGAGTGGASSGSGAEAGTGTGGASPCAGKLGPHCGASLGLDPNTLYTCNNDVPLVAEQCTAACIVHADAIDACPCPAGDKLHCGQAIGKDAGTVYQCTQGLFSEVAVCVAACDVAAAGVNDSCAKCPSGDGAYCGSGIGKDPKIIYQCKNGQITPGQQCPSACMVNPPGKADTCGPCPNGNGGYCGAAIGMNPNTLYDCQNGIVTPTQNCPSTCHSAPPGQNDYCEGNGKLLCSSVQWWNVGLTYGPYKIQNGPYTWWDTDLAVASGTPIQLRHDSKLVADPVQPWGWQPQFIDQQTGDRFQFLHMRPQNKYTTAIGTVYPAGTIVGLSGGNTADTGLGKYSTGSHLCVETIAAWLSAFPKGKDACN